MKINLSLWFAMLIVLLTVFSSCTNNDELIAKYEEIKVQIAENKYEELLQNFDKRSRQYIELVADTSQLDYENLKIKSEKFNLKHFTINYLFEFSGFNEEMENKYDAVFLYYKLKGVPLFELFSEQELVKDEIKTGNENYVTVARKVKDKTYITKKIKFVKEGDEYKLNFIDLLSKNEKKIKVAVKRYKDKYFVKIPDEIKNNENIDSTKRRDFLYTYMHFSRKDDYKPTGYYYKKSAEKRRRIQ